MGTDMWARVAARKKGCGSAVIGAALLLAVGADGAQAQDAWEVSGLALGSVMTYSADGGELGKLGAGKFDSFPQYVFPSDSMNGMVPLILLKKEEKEKKETRYVKEMFLKIKKGVCPSTLSSSNNASDSLATSGAGTGC